MKKLVLFFLSFSTLILISCSSNESEIISNTSPNINKDKSSKVQSYTIDRNPDGSYFINFDTPKNTKIDTYKNPDNTNEIVISQTHHLNNNKEGKTQFLIDDGLLKINILEATNKKNSYITIEDDFYNKKKSDKPKFLNDYSLTKNTDGSFTLNFEVKDNVIADFIYNEKNKTHEVHLKSGKSKNKYFSRNINVSDKKILKIDFVNHKYNKKSKRIHINKKPRQIIEEVFI